MIKLFRNISPLLSPSPKVKHIHRNSGTASTSSQKQQVQSQTRSHKRNVARQKLSSTSSKVPTALVELEYEPGFRLFQLAIHNAPFHYQPKSNIYNSSKSSNIYNSSKKQGVNANVDPSKVCEGVMNVIVIKNKKDGKIRISIDSTPWNPRMQNVTNFMYETPSRNTRNTG